MLHANILCAWKACTANNPCSSQICGCCIRARGKPWMPGYRHSICCPSDWIMPSMHIDSSVAGKCHHVRCATSFCRVPSHGQWYHIPEIGEQLTTAYHLLPELKHITMLLTARNTPDAVRTA